ncbi:MAG: DUF1572 family protein [Melioribacteraceae bacterium]|nr:DUF1572 family protein [Melioribacteraceae bacterium]
MIRKQFIDDILRQLKRYRDIAENSLALVPDEKFFGKSDNISNSIAILIKHLSENMRSGFSNFLTPEWQSYRDGELGFQLSETGTRDSIMQNWEESWEILLKTISSLAPDDLEKTVYIRQETHTVFDVINSQMAYYAFHIGQIALLAKHFAGN